MDVQTRLPLALKLVQIQEYEGKWLVPLLEAAQRNWGSAAHMGTSVSDRGYVEGQDLWQVHQLGVVLVMVGKANMAVVQDAHGLAKGARVVRHGQGTQASEERLRTAVVGLEAFTSYDS